MNHRQRRWFFCDQFQNKNNDPIKIKQQSKSDIKGLVDDIKVNVIENVGTADICDRLNIACNIKSLSCKIYYPTFRGKILFWCPTVGQL